MRCDWLWPVRTNNRQASRHPPTHPARAAQLPPRPVNKHKEHAFSSFDLILSHPPSYTELSYSTARPRNPPITAQHARSADIHTTFCIDGGGGQQSARIRRAPT